MKITEMVEKYYFHDSGIAKVEFDQEKREATLLIDFCNWAQKNYTDDQEENIVLKLVFSNVTSMLGEKPLLDANEILDCQVIENGRTLEFYTIRTDIANRSREHVPFRIVAEDVTVTQVGVGWYEPPS